MEREDFALHVFPAIGVALVVLMVLLVFLTTVKRKHLSPFFAFKAYVLFGAVTVFGGYMAVSPFLKGHTLAEVLALDDEPEEVADDPTPPPDVEPPKSRELPEMSEAEAHMTISLLKARSSFSRVNGIEKLLKRSPPERNRQAVFQALHPLTNDPDDEVREAARRAMATLR